MEEKIESSQARLGPAGVADTTFARHVLTMSTDYMAVIDQIEAIRSRNNKNWMDLLRLAFKHAPEDAAEIMAGIYKEDAAISALVGKLTQSSPIS